MQTRVRVRFLFFVFCAFLFSSGFLGFCQGPDYKPCSIVFTDPPNGTIYALGTESVTIHGRVVAGDNTPLILKAQSKTITFDASTGEFEYVFTLDQSAVYSACTFEVTDTKYIANKERISFALGQGIEPGTDGVVDNAVRAVFTDGFIDEVEIIGARFLAKWKYDMIYGWDDPVYGSGDVLSPFTLIPSLLPLSVTGVPLGEAIVIDNDMTGSRKGYANFGEMSMSLDILANSTISASVDITPETGVNPNGGSDAVYLQGYHKFALLGNPNFTITADTVHVSNAKLKLSENKQGKIVANLDLGDADINLVNAQVQYGFLTVPSWLMNFMMQFMKTGILDLLTLNIPIIDVNSLGIDILGINASGWPMDTANFFSSTATQMRMDLGLAAELSSGTTPFVPGLTKFYYTPGNTLPEVGITGEENFAVALSDDIANNLAYAAVQAGIVNEMDVTEIVELQLGVLTPAGLYATATLNTPPILDFSGVSTDGVDVANVGRVIISNMIADIYIDPDGAAYPLAMRLSVDLSAPLKIKLKDDGTHLIVGIDTANSVSKVTTLYTNIVSSALVPSIGSDIANFVINLVLERTLNIKLPNLDIFETGADISLIGSELANDCLVLKVKVLQ